MDDGQVIASVADMHRLLRDTERAKAADFVRAQHERACRNQSCHRMQFWEDVLLLLAIPEPPAE